MSAQRLPVVFCFLNFFKFMPLFVERFSGDYTENDFVCEKNVPVPELWEIFVVTCHGGRGHPVNEWKTCPPRSPTNFKVTEPVSNPAGRESKSCTIGSPLLLFCISQSHATPLTLLPAATLCLPSSPFTFRRIPTKSLDPHLSCTPTLHRCH